MADQKVSDLPSLNGVDVDPADLLYIVDSSAGTAGSKKITMGQFDVYTAAVSQTLTNKTISGSNNTLSNISLASSVTGTLPVANGGTGAATFTANNVLLGNGTSAFQTVAPGASGNLLTSDGTNWISSAPAASLATISFGTTGLTPSTPTGGAVTVAGTLAAANGGTGLTSPGTAGNVLTSNGTAWTSAAPSGFSNMVVFTSSGTWTVPSGVTKCKVTVTGGGGGVNGSGLNGTTGAAGAGATAIKIVVLSGSSAAITIGSGGSGANVGGDSTFVYGVTTVTGGGGSAPNAGSPYGASGGSASGGDINILGGSGSDGGAQSNSGGFPGTGGASYWGGGGGRDQNGRAYGSGAGVLTSATTLSGAGGVIVIEY